MDPRDRPVVRLHLWLDTRKGIFFGLGRLKLLEKIQSGQSLRGAAQSMGMSYRAAWGKIKNSENVLGVALIEKKSGNRAGYQLTLQGIALMNCFSRWFRDVENYALRRAEVLLPCSSAAFDETQPNHSGNWAIDPEQKAPLP